MKNRHADSAACEMAGTLPFRVNYQENPGRSSLSDSA